MSKLIIAKTNAAPLDPVGLHNIAGDQINPATNEKLDELKTVLNLIESAVDELEIKADTINLNTDTLEAKVQSVRDQLDVLLSTRASETTLTSVKTNLDDVKTKLDTLNAKDFATETTLVQVRDYLDTVETKLQSIIDNTSSSNTSVVSNVSQSISSVTIVSANASRKGVTIVNDTNANLYLKFGTVASFTSYTVQLEKNDYYEVPFNYTGIIDGIWDSSGSGAARVTELT